VGSQYSVELAYGNITYWPNLNIVQGQHREQ